MRFLCVMVVALSASMAAADGYVCVGGRCPRIAAVSAQIHANRLAESGRLQHASNYGGGAEGLGFSTSSPEAAVRNCCFWGRRTPREIATAWCPQRRGWIAVVRYE